MRVLWMTAVLFTIAASSSLSNAISLDVNDTASIKRAASTLAYGLMKYYTGNQTGNAATIGLLPAPYYWFEAGAVWGAMIDYWHYTNDTTYNNVVTQALLSQASPTKDFMPVAQQKDEGNDDQAFWGFAAMSAVERQFPSPPPTSPQWLPLAEAVFNDLSSRWDLSSCAGGLKWQIFSFNAGYDYKNVPSNGGLFQLAARLARYTGNATYLDWATKSWDWMNAVGLFDAHFNVFDGTDDTINCTQVDHVTWTYNTGMLLSGASVLANYTNSPIWQSRTTSLLSAAATNFFSPYKNSTNIMYERSCEPATACDNDQFSFKAYLARWMAASTQMMPDLQPAVLDLLHASAQAAATSCSGGTNNQTCGTKWYTGAWDGITGVGQQLSALEVVQALLVTGASAPAVASGVQISLATATTSVLLPTAATAVSKPTGGGSLQISEGVSSGYVNLGLLGLMLMIFSVV